VIRQRQRHCGPADGRPCRSLSVGGYGGAELDFKLDVSVTLQADMEPNSVTFTLNAAMLQPIVALLAGILILLIPRILNFIVAIYLIFVGVTGLWPHFLSALPH
jgi:hypothetical protein